MEEEWSESREGEKKKDSGNALAPGGGGGMGQGREGEKTWEQKDGGWEEGKAEETRWGGGGTSGRPALSPVFWRERKIPCQCACVSVHILVHVCLHKLESTISFCRSVHSYRREGAKEEICCP